MSLLADCQKTTHCGHSGTKAKWPMRRILLLMATLLFAGCMKPPTSSHEALISEMESKISLPSGSGSLDCWERHYAMIEGADIKTELGLEMPGKQLLVGKFVLGSKPGRYWHDDFESMPRIYDGGCSLLRAYHIVGEHENVIVAECSTTIGGETPRALQQPVAC